MTSFFLVQLDIILYLMEPNALGYSKKLASLAPSSCTFNPHKPLDFLDFKSNSFHWSIAKVRLKEFTIRS